METWIETTATVVALFVGLFLVYWRFYARLDNKIEEHRKHFDDKFEEHRKHFDDKFDHVLTGIGDIKATLASHAAQIQAQKEYTQPVVEAFSAVLQDSLQKAVSGPPAQTDPARQPTAAA